jgi:hypothetical protein
MQLIDRGVEIDVEPCRLPILQVQREPVAATHKRNADWNIVPVPLRELAPGNGQTHTMLARLENDTWTTLELYEPDLIHLDRSAARSDHDRESLSKRLLADGPRPRDDPWTPRDARGVDHDSDKCEQQRDDREQHPFGEHEWLLGVTVQLLWPGSQSQRVFIGFHPRRFCRGLRLALKLSSWLRCCHGGVSLTPGRGSRCRRRPEPRRWGKAGRRIGFVRCWLVWRAMASIRLSAHPGWQAQYGVVAQMGLLDDAIREHLELKRLRGVDPGQVAHEEQEALGPVHRGRTREDDAQDDGQREASFEDEGSFFSQPETTAETHTSDVGQQTVEINMHAELHDSPAAEDDPSTSREERSRPVGPARERAITDESLEWEVPGERSEEGVSPAEPNDKDNQAINGEADAVEDVLEETPDFLRETPEQERLWFEQRPPRDFDFNE